MATYRISVGRRHRIAPRQIVGALANEGGLAREDFGRIEIRAAHSLVDLPADLPPAVWKALAATRISGQRIELRLDQGGEGHGRPGSDKRRSQSGDPRSKPRKPRH